jgi:hypothetical protein
MIRRVPSICVVTEHFRKGSRWYNISARVRPVSIPWITCSDTSFEMVRLWNVFITLTEVFPCFFLSCKANARVKLAKTAHGPHSSTLVVICVVRLLFVLFYVLFVNKRVLPPGDNPTAVNLLNAELNLLALLGAHHVLHVSGIGVNKYIKYQITVDLLCHFWFVYWQRNIQYIKYGIHMYNCLFYYCVFFCKLCDNKMC